MEPRSGTETVGVLERSLDVLELLAGSGSPTAFAEIVDAVHAPKATVHRLLKILQARGYVSQDSRTGRYSAGIRCFELGSLWAKNLDLRATAAPQLAALNELTAETVHLAVYDQGDVIYIDRVESQLPVIAKSYVGRRCPATCVATGRVLLAYESLDEIDRVLSSPLPRYTERSITDPARLRDLLAEVRGVGFSVNHGSYRDDVGGVAAPIRDHTGRVLAAVGLCLPEHRFGPERFDGLCAETVRAAARITAALGGVSLPVVGRADQ
jgi:DNA-binding IclR family transcriptional regulator